jgi:hypothetical protein
VNPTRGCDGNAPISTGPALPATRPTVNLRPRLGRGIDTSALPMAHAGPEEAPNLAHHQEWTEGMQRLKLQDGLYAAAQAAGKGTKRNEG